MAKRKSDALITDDEIASTSSKPSKSTLIENLNALDQAALKTRFFADASKTKHPHDDMIWTTQLYFPYNVPNLRECHKLIETTSKHDYAPSSFGWHPKRKWNEMNEREMRYLVVEGTSPGALPLPRFGGFLSFMFTHDSTPAVPVVYIYEIHLTKSARGKGLGGFLMRTVENVAKEAGLDKVMLTCFLSNENALSFYRKHGFEADACSPGDRETRNKIVKTDYVIMSKDVSGKEGRSRKTPVEVKQEVLEEGDTLANANGVREGSQAIGSQSSVSILSKPARCRPHEVDSYQRKLHELEAREE